MSCQNKFLVSCEWLLTEVRNYGTQGLFMCIHCIHCRACELLLYTCVVNFWTARKNLTLNAS